MNAALSSLKKEKSIAVLFFYVMKSEPAFVFRDRFDLL